MGLFAVALGAFGAHALRGSLSIEQLGSYQTAVQYQFWHALALLAVGTLAYRQPSRCLYASGGLFATGTVLFSGSLYVLVLTNVRELGAFKVGLVTPAGGVCLILGWLLLAIAAWRS